VLHTEIIRVVEKLLIVGATVEDDGQHPVGGNAAYR
jgi:hypothetical protein